MMIPALRYLTLRALGAPAVLLSLAMQGVFRGFKDTKTPLYATGKITIARAVELDHQTIVIDLPKKKIQTNVVRPFLTVHEFQLVIIRLSSLLAWISSGRRPGEHRAGSDLDIWLPHGRGRRRHRPCSLSVSPLISCNPRRADMICGGTGMAHPAGSD